MNERDPKQPPPAGAAEPATGAFPPGDPAGPLEDEFAHIPSPPRRPPVVALVAVALALFLAYRLRDDVAYAMSARTPIEISDARALGRLGADAMPLNRYVRITGRPERESALLLDTRGSWRFTQFFRLHGTRGRVFVKRAPDPLPVEAAERDVFSGRLVRFADLSFADSITRHFAARVSGLHFFAPATLRAALARGSGLVLNDRAGAEVKLAPDDLLALDLARPGEFRIDLGPDRRAEVARVRSLVTTAGGRVLSEKETPELHVLEAAIPPAVLDDTLSRLGQLGRGLHFRPARDSVEIPVSALAADPGGGIKLGADRVVALDQVLAARTRAAVEVPADAVLLLEGELPGREIKAIVILAFLAAFAAVNLLGLRRLKS